MNLEQKKLLFKNGGLREASIECFSAEDNNVQLGSARSNVFFEKSVRIQSSVITGLKGVFFGAYSYMNAGGYVRDDTFIGRYCSIGRRVTISAGMHRTNGLTTYPLKPRVASLPYSADDKLEKKSSASSTFIESDVWIGDGAVIMPGITIGVGSIIAANAVVTKDVNPYSVVGGVPARVISMRFDDNIIATLLQSKWWELGKEQLEELPINNIYQAMEAIVQVSPPQVYETYFLLNSQ